MWVAYKVSRLDLEIWRRDKRGWEKKDRRKRNAIAIVVIVNEAIKRGWEDYVDLVEKVTPINSKDATKRLACIRWQLIYNIWIRLS